MASLTGKLNPRAFHELILRGMPHLANLPVAASDSAREYVRKNVGELLNHGISWLIKCLLIEHTRVRKLFYQLYFLDPAQFVHAKIRLKLLQKLNLYSILDSDFVLSNTLVRSTQKLFIFTIGYNICRIKVSQKQLFNFQNESTDSVTCSKQTIVVFHGF